MAQMNFPTFVALHYKRMKREYSPPNKLLCLDPGQTTGWAIFTDGILDKVGQLITDPVERGALAIQELIANHQPDLVLYEEYKVYSWKAVQHSWSALHTPNLIGAIRTLCVLNEIPTYNQMAQQPKRFCTDQKLRDWKYYHTAQRHARDAIRHGCYYLMFNLWQYPKLQK